MKKICLLLALVMLLGFVVSCTGSNDDEVIDNEASETNTKEKKQSLSEREVSKNQFNNVKVGDYITFGKYEQDNDLTNGKEEIEWLVLDVQDGKALVISKYALDHKSYNTEHGNITWENCSLRRWLNDDFFNEAFSTAEKSIISMETVPADKNPNYDTDPGDATLDKVFCLSINEANKYFNSDCERVCDITAYADSKNVISAKGGCVWWLRTPGFYQTQTAIIFSGGDIYELGAYSESNSNVRPAMWINIES